MRTCIFGLLLLALAQACERRPTGAGNDVPSGPIRRYSPEQPLEIRWLFADLPVRLARGAEVAITVAFKNTASKTLTEENLSISYHWRFADSNRVAEWDGLRSKISSAVPSAAIFTSDSVHVRAPSSPGQYVISFDLVREGVAWFSGLGCPTLDRLVLIE